MTTLSELLQQADPLGYEEEPNAPERRLIRERVVARAEASRPRRRTRVAVVALAAIVVAAIATGYWSVTAAVRFEVRLADDRPAAGLTATPVSGNRTIYLQSRAVVSNSDIAQAEVVPGSGVSMFNVLLTFTPAGAARMLRATQGHLGRPLAILLDGDVVMAPVVRSPISTSAMITGNYTRAEADRIVNGIVGR
jgi:hypothetical protein